MGFWLKTDFSGPTERVTWRAPYGNENYGYLEFRPGATVSGPRVNNFSITGIDDEEANGDVRINVTAEVIGFDAGEFRDLPNPLPGIQAPAAATLTVEDDDSEETTVTLSVDEDEVGEGAEPTGITVTGTLTGETPTAAVEVTLSVESGTGADGAVAGADFAPVEEFGLTIPVGQASATASFTLTPIEDTVDEPAETLTLSGATEASGVGIAGTVTLSLTDNDDAPSLVLSVEPDTIAEDGGTATVTVSTGSGSTYAGPRTVTLALTGTATRGSDYTVGSTSLVLPAGIGTEASSVTTTLRGVDDEAADPGETVVVTGSVDGTAFGDAQTVTIDDDEGAPRVTLLLTPEAVLEGGSATVTAEVAPAPDEPFTLTVTAEAGAGADAGDFTLSGTTLSFAAGAAQSTGTVTIEATDDNHDDGDRTVTVSGAVSAAGVRAPPDVELALTDDDEAPSLVLDVDPLAVREDGGTATVRVTTGVGSTFETEKTVTLALAGTAVLDEDYTLSSATLTLPAGEGFEPSQATAEIAALDDERPEGDETVVVTGTVDGEAFGEARTLVIADNEGAPRVRLLLSTASVSENGGGATVTATVSPASPDPFTVTVAAAPEDPAGPEDFVLEGTLLSFAAAATESTGEVSVTAVDNDEDAPDRTVTVSGTVSLETIAAPLPVTLTITDDDAPDPPDDETPVVTLVLTPPSIAENGGVSTVTATVSPASPDPFTVTVAAAPEDPAGPEDFVLEGTLLSFAAAATESTGEVSVTAVDNDEDAPDRTVTVSGTVSLETVTAPLPVTLTITDDDAPDPPDDETPVVTLVLTPPSIAENGGVSTVTATVSPASPDPFTVTLTATPVDPAGPEDFVLEGTLLSFAAASTESTGEVRVTAVDNDEDTPDRTVTVSGTVSLGTVTAPLPVTLTILDDDEPAVTLVLTPPSIAENGGVSTVTATVFPASPEPFTVTLAAAPEDPAGPEDFVLEGTLLSFAAASTESTGEVRVTAVDNDEDTPDRTVTVSGTVSLGTVTAPLPVTLTIADDDEGTPPVERGVDIFPTELTIGEGDEAGGTFSVTLTAEPSEPVTVTVFVPAASNLIVDPSELVFTPADWNIPQTVKVTAPEDDDAEPRTVPLSYSATGSGYDDVPVTDVDVTVTDRIDPGRPELRIADARGPEAGGALLFELTLSHAAEGPVTVEYATRDGTARGGEDYEAIQGTATVAPGEVGTRIAVPLHIDVFREPDESFLLELSRADGARLADDGEATGVIEDEARMASEWLARLGRLVGQDVMAAVEERITAPRAAGSELTVAGLRLAGGETPFGRDGTQLEPSGQAGPGSAPPAAWTALNSWNAATSLWPAARDGTPTAQPGEGPRGGDGPLAIFGAALGFPGAGGLGGSTALRGVTDMGTRLRALGAGTSGGADLLANSAFRLDTGPGGGRGPALWGRGAYTRFEPFGDGLQTGGKALSATLGADVAWSWGLVGLAASHTAADASYGVAGQTAGALAATLTGLYPYFGLQLGERITVWGLAGRGRGEQIVTPEAGGDGPAPVTLENDLAGLGARAELVAAERGFSLAMKTDALLSRARTVEGQGLLPAEGEWRRVRVGLESAWVAEFDDGAALRSSIEAAALEDAGDAENGLGAQVGASLRFVDVAPGLSLTLAARGLVSHEVEDYEEWSASGGIRYDPEPSSPAGPQVSLTHAWGTEAGGALPRAPGLDGLPRPAPIPGASGDGRLGAALAWGFGAFGGVAVPWAEVALSGDERDYRLGYRLLTPGGMPSLEVGTSAYGLHYSAGWEFTFRCRAHLAVHVRRTGAGLEGPKDTGFTLRLRALGPQGTSCRTPEPPLTSAAPF